VNTLRIYFSGQWRDPAAPCPWALCDASGAVLQTGSDPLAAMPKCGVCIGIAAPDRVLCTAARLPPGSRRRWQTILPFVAEESTVSDPGDNHVIPGPTLADGRTALTIVDKQWLARIVAACRVAKLPLRRMTPETLLPACSPETWVLVLDGSGGFLRTGEAGGMALDSNDAASAPLALRLSLNAAAKSSPPSTPRNIEVRFSQQTPESQRSLPQWNGLPAALSAGPAWDWRRAPIPNGAPNLLWGGYAPRFRIGEHWPKWRSLAWILLAALAIETAGANIEWALLASEKQALTREMERSFRTSFGENSAVVNAPLQMQRGMAKLRHAAGLPDNGDFLPLLDGAAAALAALPPGSVRALHYEGGRLDVDLALTGKESFRPLQQRLQDGGLGVRASDIRDAGSGVQARLTLLPGSAP
jgi:general secretion pathway protein L